MAYGRNGGPQMTARDDIHKASPGPDRAERRSRFFPGLADAMADQWGGWALEVAA